MGLAEATSSIKEHEGFSYDPYKLKYKVADKIVTEPFWTGGYGHKLTKEEYLSFDKNWSQERKKNFWDKIFQDDISKVSESLEELKKTYRLNTNEQQDDILLEMIYQMGKGGVKKFNSMLIALSQNPPDTEEAYWQMITRNGKGTLPSVWYLQTTKRANRLANLMRNS